MSPMLAGDDPRAVSFARAAFWRGVAYGWLGGTALAALLWWWPL